MIEVLGHFVSILTNLLESTIRHDQYPCCPLYLNEDCTGRVIQKCYTESLYRPKANLKSYLFCTLIDVRISVVYLSNRLFFFERCSLITATVCAYALARYENLFAHTIAVIRLHLSKKNIPLLIFTFLKHFLHCILIF